MMNSSDKSPKYGLYTEFSNTLTCNISGVNILSIPAFESLYPCHVTIRLLARFALRQKHRFSDDCSLAQNALPCVSGTHLTALELSPDLVCMLCPGTFFYSDFLFRFIFIFIHLYLFRRRRRRHESICSSYIYYFIDIPIYNME